MSYKQIGAKIEGVFLERKVARLPWPKSKLLKRKVLHFQSAMPLPNLILLRWQTRPGVASVGYPANGYLLLPAIYLSRCPFSFHLQHKTL